MQRLDHPLQKQPTLPLPPNNPAFQTCSGDLESAQSRVSQTISSSGLRVKPAAEPSKRQSGKSPDPRPVITDRERQVGPRLNLLPACENSPTNPNQTVGLCPQ